jgi:hypothetical protein
MSGTIRQEPEPIPDSNPDVLKSQIAYEQKKKVFRGSATLILSSVFVKSGSNLNTVVYL